MLYPYSGDDTILETPERAPKVARENRKFDYFLSYFFRNEMSWLKLNPTKPKQKRLLFQNLLHSHLKPKTISNLPLPLVNITSCNCMSVFIFFSSHQLNKYFNRNWSSSTHYKSKNSIAWWPWAQQEALTTRETKNRSKRNCHTR